jgi:predicted nucleotidyltransferase
MRIDARRVIARRGEERQALIEPVAHWAEHLDPNLGVQAVVVFGSVARGDFNVWSDIDVLVVAENLADRFLDRLDTLGSLPPLVQPVVWTPREFAQQLARANPITTESVQAGVWVVGDAGLFAEPVPGDR